MIPARDVRSIRARLGLTQAAFALLLGVSPRSIVSWEAHGVPDRSEARFRARLEGVREAGGAASAGSAASGGSSVSGASLPLGEAAVSSGSAALPGSAPFPARSASHPAPATAPGLAHAIPEADLRETALALRDFATRDLLHELLRRSSQWDVGGEAQTEDLHTVDLRSEYDLAASLDDTGIDPTRGEA